MRVRFRDNDFYFRHRDHRQKTDEEEKERSENAQRADERPDVDPGRDKQAPGRRQEVAVQSADDDNETLEPHAGVHAHADEINDVDIATAPSEPKQLRREHVAEKHSHPPVPPVRTKDAIEEGEALILIAA